MSKQSFSLAGKRNIYDIRTPLFIYIIDIVEQLNPKYVLIENVPGFLTSSFVNEEGKEDKIMNRFNNVLGKNYNILSNILNTKDFNVPQSRKRAIMLLSRKDVEMWNFPEIVTKKSITVRDTISHLPTLESGQSHHIHKFHKANKHNDKHILWMKHTPTGKTAYDNERHYPQKDGRKIKGFRTTYKRIDWDKPATTITMSNGSVSSQNTVHPGRFIKETNTYSDARVLTIYEIMLLTGLQNTWEPHMGTSTVFI
jgi:DNA (cytosine-5)-methyltransferase 1